MNVLEAVKIALGSLIANPLRSFLTLLGIIIGIGAIISVISVINGLNIYVAEKLSNLGPGVFVVDRFGIITNREDFLRALRRNKKVTMADARALRERMELAESVGVEVHATVEVKYRGEIVKGTDLGGVSQEIMEIEPYEVETGRTLTPNEIERASPVAYIGWEIADKLFPGTDPIGKKIRVGNRNLLVVGQSKKKGSVLGFSRDNFVKIPLPLHQKMFGMRRSVNISVKSADPVDMQPAMDEARSIMRARHKLGFREDDDFGMMSAAGLTTLWENLTRVIFRVAIFVVGISLVVGGIVIMNIMLVSVIERTREIGVRKAVGARPRDIRLQFLIESVVLSCAGGFIGIAGAFAFSWLLSTYTPLPARFPLWAPVLAFVICGAIGVFFGLHPAAKASRLDPIEALRAEG